MVAAKAADIQRAIVVVHAVAIFATVRRSGPPVPVRAVERTIVIEATVDGGESGFVAVTTHVREFTLNGQSPAFGADIIGCVAGAVSSANNTRRDSFVIVIGAV